MSIENKLRELLIPCFGLNTIDEIQPHQALVNDLGATSIDFVEISYIIESHFGVIIKTDELMIGGTSINPHEIFEEGILTEKGAAVLNGSVNSTKFKVGQTRRALYESITIADLAHIIEIKMADKK